MKQVAAAIVINDGHVLVARRAPGQHLEGHWEFPGGKLEGDESPQSCVVRELREELSLTVSPRDVLAASLHEYPGGAINLIAVLSEADSRLVTLTVHDAVDWVNPNALSHIALAPADIPIAEEVARHFGAIGIVKE